MLNQVDFAIGVSNQYVLLWVEAIRHCDKLQVHFRPIVLILEDSLAW